MENDVTQLDDEGWKRIIEDQKGSGLSIPAYCQREGIADHKFYRRRRRLFGVTGRKSESPGFIELTAQRSTGHDLQNTVDMLCGPWTIRVVPETSDALLEKALRAIQRVVL